MEHQTMNRARFFGMLAGFTAGDLLQVQIAYWLAKNAHRMQTRDDGERYFEHPRRVAVSLVASGTVDAGMICLALCHDVVEDTNTPTPVVVDLFGTDFWRDLVTLSKYVPVFDPVTGQIIGRYKKPLDDYFAEIAAAPIRVRRVKVRDRTDNLADMLTAPRWDDDRRARYREETERYLVPISAATDARDHADLLTALKGMA